MKRRAIPGYSNYGGVPGYSNYGGGGPFAPMHAPARLSDATSSARPRAVGKRYYIEPCDNLGTVTPAPPRDRTWLVMDRATGRQHSEHDRRLDARTEADRLNRPNTSQKES